MIKRIAVIGYLMLFFMGSSHGAQLTRVILASDTHPFYIQFWPLVAMAWKKIVGIQPTLLLIAEEDYPIDTSVGDVIRVAPIPGVPTWLHAQVIRLLGGAYFEGDICIISDIDMVPLSKAYFLESLRGVPEDHFIVYRDGHDPQRFPMCYNAAKGSVYKEVFSIRSTVEIPQKILEWTQRGLGWNTDELLLTEYVKAWHAATGRVAFLGHQVTDRIDRLTWLAQGCWSYETHQLRAGNYIDAHLLRPFTTYQRENLSILKDLGFSRQELIYVVKELAKQ